MRTATERYFLAIPLPDFVQAALAQLREDRKGFHWTAAANRHLTLKFIGDCTAEQRERIEIALSPVTVSRFFVQLGGMGVFPRRGPAKVIWVGVAPIHPHLFALHQQIDDTLFGLGIEPDKTRYTPHVTIARSRDASPETIRQYLKKHPDFETPPFFPRTYCLVQSVLGAGPPRHHIVWENELPEA